MFQQQKTDTNIINTFIFIKINYLNNPSRSNNTSPEPTDFEEFMRPNEMWEEMENAGNREEAKKYLQIMNARQEYLKNPASNSKNSPDSAEFHNPPFKAEPAKLVFTKFKVGQGKSCRE